jgi:thioesterase domain-containing protein
LVGGSQSSADRCNGQEVAAAIAPKIYEGQNGQAALSELPIHLIGHSRGGGMVYELARLLGEQGIEVEQVTSLDPHPLTTSDTQGSVRHGDRAKRLIRPYRFMKTFSLPTTTGKVSAIQRRACKWYL